MLLARTNRFKRDYKQVLKRGCARQRMVEVLTLLVNEQPLPASCRPHKLGGEYSGYWECHLSPDWLLIYEYYEDELILRRTGTHSDLFR